MDNLQPGTAPKVTPADIEAQIEVEVYIGGADSIKAQTGGAVPAHLASLELLTICILILRNGFTVTGESACASPENFDADVGRKVARAAAVAKCWPLLGYQLRTQLSNQAQHPVPESAADAYRQRVWTEPAPRIHSEQVLWDPVEGQLWPALDLQREMLAEQVRELRLRNDAQEMANRNAAS